MWDLIVIGLAITLEPLPVIGFIVVLAGQAGTRKGAAYIAGWVVCLVAIVVAVLAATGGHPPKSSSPPGEAVSAIKLALGVALLGIALRFHRRAAAPRPPRPPAKWVTRIDTMSVWAAATLGVLLQPWPLVAAGAAQIAQADVSSVTSMVYVVLFCLLATASIASMEVYALVSPDAADQRLDTLRHRLETHRDRGIEVLALVVGLVMVSQGIYGLA